MKSHSYPEYDQPFTLPDDLGDQFFRLIRKSDKISKEVLVVLDLGVKNASVGRELIKVLTDIEHAELNEKKQRDLNIAVADEIIDNATQIIQRFRK